LYIFDWLSKPGERLQRKMISPTVTSNRKGETMKIKEPEIKREDILVLED